jgi:hypothetical protein
VSQLTSIDVEAVPESNKYENNEFDENANFRLKNSPQKEDSYAGCGSDQTVSEINGEQRYEDELIELKKQLD